MVGVEQGSAQAGLANSTSKVPQRTVKIALFTVAGRRCPFVRRSLFSLVRVRQVAVMAFPPGDSCLIFETRIRNSKRKLGYSLEV
jgi:hypothetical protein